MANTPEQVLGFLHDLAARAKPFAEKDLQELKAFAKADWGWTRSSPGTWPRPRRSCAKRATPTPTRR